MGGPSFCKGVGQHGNVWNDNSDTPPNTSQFQKMHGSMDWLHSAQLAEPACQAEQTWPPASHRHSPGPAHASMRAQLHHNAGGGRGKRSGGREEGQPGWRGLRESQESPHMSLSLGYPRPPPKVTNGSAPRQGSD